MAKLLFFCTLLKWLISNSKLHFAKCSILNSNMLCTTQPFPFLQCNTNNEQLKSRLRTQFILFFFFRWIFRLAFVSILTAIQLHSAFLATLMVSLPILHTQFIVNSVLVVIKWMYMFFFHCVMSKIGNASGIYSHMFLLIKLSFIESFTTHKKQNFTQNSTHCVHIGHTIPNHT